MEADEHAPRRSLATLKKVDIPTDPGVYALYRDGVRMYVGKADCLQDHIWKNHRGRGPVMTSSALRRNVAEHLRFATATDIKARRYQPTATQVAEVGAWLEGCEIAWITCETTKAAKNLKDDFKAEFMPPLTKR